MKKILFIIIICSVFTSCRIIAYKISPNVHSLKAYDVEVIDYDSVKVTINKTDTVNGYVYLIQRLNFPKLYKNVIVPTLTPCIEKGYRFNLKKTNTGWESNPIKIESL